MPGTHAARDGAQAHVVLPVPPVPPEVWLQPRRVCRDVIVLRQCAPLRGRDLTPLPHETGPTHTAGTAAARCQHAAAEALMRYMHATVPALSSRALANADALRCCCWSDPADVLTVACCVLRAA